MKIAFVHDYLNQMGGAEKVLQALLELYPEAPVYTLLADEKILQENFSNATVYTSFLNRLPLSSEYHRYYMWLMPYAVEQWQLGKYDLVVSDSASYTKGVIAGPRTYHLNYCHTPTRYLWHEEKEKIKTASFPGWLKKFMPPWLHYQRMWDFQAAQRPDEMVANSRYIQSLIRKFYNREAEVVYPPAELNRFLQEESQKGDYFLLVGRLLPYKRFDVAIEAAKQAGVKLKIAGDGRDYKRLRRLKNDDIEFLGFVGDQELSRLYAKARGLLFPQVEDFGIAAVESLAAGTPVIAYGQGGAKEIVEEGKTGLFFDRQAPASLASVLRDFNPKQFQKETLEQSAQKFSKATFQQNMQELISQHKS